MFKLNLNFYQHSYDFIDINLCEICHSVRIFIEIQKAKVNNLCLQDNLYNV